MTVPPTMATAEVSLYPLRTRELAEPIERFVETLRAHPELDITLGAMSTRVAGPAPILFQALSEAYQVVASTDAVVLTVKVANTCPTG